MEITKDTTADELATRHSIGELRTEANRRDLAVTGSRADVAARLVEHARRGDAGDDRDDRDRGGDVGRQDDEQTDRPTQPRDRSDAPAADDRDRRIAELERRLQAAEQGGPQNTPNAPETAEPEPTHVLILADGTTVETATPIATHHYVDGKGLVPVSTCYLIGA